MTAPVGLLGEASNSAFVRSVIAASIAAAVNWKPSSGDMAIITGTASTMRAVGS